MRRPHFVTIRHFICPPATTTFGSCRLQLYYYYFYIAIARALKKKPAAQNIKMIYQWKRIVLAHTKKETLLLL